MSAPKKLQTVLRRLNKIPNINAGGCGISALAIYRWCKNHGVSVGDRPFVIITNDRWDVTHNNELIQNKEISSRLEYPHIVIDIGGKLHDSTGNEDDDNEGNFASWNLRCDPLNEEELLELINEGSWNWSFERDRYLNVIARQVGVDLDDVDY